MIVRSQNKERCIRSGVDDITNSFSVVLQRYIEDYTDKNADTDRDEIYESDNVEILVCQYMMGIYSTRTEGLKVIDEIVSLLIKEERMARGEEEKTLIYYEMPVSDLYFKKKLRRDRCDKNNKPKKRQDIKLKMRRSFSKYAIRASDLYETERENEELRKLIAGTTEKSKELEGQI